MWTAENRPRYNRDKLRYPSDQLGGHHLVGDLLAAAGHDDRHGVLDVGRVYRSLTGLVRLGEPTIASSSSLMPDTP
jgi:hypothetical protein